MAPAGIPAVLCGNPLDKMPPCLHNVFQLFEIGLFNTTNCHLYHYAGNNPVRYVDPDGSETKKGVDINLLPKNEATYSAANEKILDANRFFVAAHGDGTMIYEYPDSTPTSERRGRGQTITPETLVNRIKVHENYKPGMTIVLWSCYAGNQENSGSDCYAQQIADLFDDGTIVIAPDQFYFIAIDSKGKNFIGFIKDDGTPDFDAPKGYMRTFTRRKR